MSLAARLGDMLAQGHARETRALAGDGGRSDHVSAPVAAAVLIPITARVKPGVILTQRPQSMRKHPGQVAFPGGRVDPEDRDVIAAALREAEEEIGLARDVAQIIGTTDLYHTITGYQVTPVLALVPPDLAYVANTDEVEAIFEVPLAYLLDPAHHQIQQLDWQGGTRHYYEINWQDRRIWGATAAMIVNLSRRLTWS